MIPLTLTFQGGAKYDYGAQSDARISVPLEIEGVQTTAIVDTGAPYLICSPDIAERIVFSDGLGSVRLNTHAGILTGQRYRGRAKLVPEKGEGTEFEATIFVPENEEWRGKPSFLGFHCCLERIRFAVDPSKEMFYFADAGAD